jgi:DNA-directed RNA polymerase subunit RPC12/RpoP
MAHQYIEQLTEEVRAAVFGNVGTIIMFRVGSPDAAFLETEFMPRFTPEDLVNLAKYEIYLRLMIDGVASEPFSAVTLPPIAQKTESSDAVIAASRARYARSRDIVASEIVRWSEAEGGGVEVVESATAGEVEKKFEQAETMRRAAKKFGNKPLFEYDCSRCGKHMILPVELDRTRPIYCEECIEVVREERKSGKKRGEERGREAKKIAGSSPVVRDGSLVTREAEATISLSALKLPETKSAGQPAPAAVAAGESPRRRRRRHKPGGGGGPSVSPRPNLPPKSKDDVFPW